MFGIIALSLARLQVSNTTNAAPVVAKDTSATEALANMTIAENHGNVSMASEEKTMNMDDYEGIKDLMDDMLWKVEKDEMDIVKEKADKKVIEMVMKEIVEKVVIGDGMIVENMEIEDGEIVDTMETDDNDQAKKKAEFQEYFEAAKQDLRSTLKHRRKGIKRKHQQHQEAAKQAKKARSNDYQQ